MTSSPFIYFPYPSAFSIFHFATLILLRFEGPLFQWYSCQYCKLPCLLGLLSYSIRLKSNFRATHSMLFFSAAGETHNRADCTIIISWSSVFIGYESARQFFRYLWSTHSSTLHSGYSKPFPAFSNAQLSFLPTISQQMPLFHVSQRINIIRLKYPQQSRYQPTNITTFVPLWSSFLPVTWRSCFSSLWKPIP